jgi:hypothetical protein
MAMKRVVVYGTLGVLALLVALFVIVPILSPHQKGDPAVIAAAAAASAAIARVPGEDFHGVYIGADEARIVAALGATVARSQEQEQWHGAYSDLWIPAIDVGGVQFEAFFQMDDDTDLLRTILLRKEKKWNGQDHFADDYARIEASLNAQYGPSVNASIRNGKGRIWTVGRTGINLEYTQVPLADHNWEMLTVRYQLAGQP